MNSTLTVIRQLQQNTSDDTCHHENDTELKHQTAYFFFRWKMKKYPKYKRMESQKCTQSPAIAGRCERSALPIGYLELPHLFALA